MCIGEERGDSLRVLGEWGPPPNQNIIMFEKAELPIGKCIQYKYPKDNLPSMTHTEYLLFNPNRIRLRYLIKVLNYV